MEEKGYTIRCGGHNYITLEWNGKFIFCLDNDMQYAEEMIYDIEVVQAKNIINDPELKVVFTSEDLDFMNKELGRQAGAVFARILRAIKKMDFKEAQRVITGGKSR